MQVYFCVHMKASIVASAVLNQCACSYDPAHLTYTCSWDNVSLETILFSLMCFFAFNKSALNIYDDRMEMLYDVTL